MPPLPWPRGLRAKYACRAGLVLVSMAPVFSSPACGDDETGGSGSEGTQTVHGLIREVIARSLVELESLTAEDDEGRRREFDWPGEIFDGFTPSHLREHMVLGLSVTVAFHLENGALIIDGIADQAGPASGPPCLPGRHPTAFRAPLVSQQGPHGGLSRLDHQPGCAGASGPVGGQLENGR